jgi:type IV secretory pathway TrbL component
MSLAVDCGVRTSQIGSRRRCSGAAMLRAARSRLQGRAAAFSSVLVQAAAGSMGVTKMAAAAKERAAARAAIDPADDAKASDATAAACRPVPLPSEPAGCFSLPF